MRRVLVTGQGSRREAPSIPCQCSPSSPAAGCRCQVSLGLTKVAAFTYAAGAKRYRLQLLPDGRLAVRRGGGWEELTAALARSPRLAAAGITGAAVAAAAASGASAGAAVGAAHG